MKWLNLGYETFHNMVQSRITPSFDDDLIEQIYASVLDVSFAHAGGIIAVVSDISKLITGSKPILDICDNLLDRRSLSEIEDEMKIRKKISKEERKKRILKRKVISSLVQEHKFADLDRKLRTELISMDGACILNCNGDICAAGAIISNDGGSSGGGRSAAARKLSKRMYGGFAVKVSTDGYIELFGDNELVYAIK